MGETTHWSKLEYGIQDDDVLEENENEEGRRDDIVLTGRTSMDDSEEELLSQQDNDDDGCDLPPVTFLQSRDRHHSDDDGSGTDISKTQPYPIPRGALNASSSRRSLSSLDDEEDDDDSITDCPEQQCEEVDFYPMHESSSEVRKNLGAHVPDDATRRSSSAKSMDEEKDDVSENRIVLHSACVASHAGPAEVSETTTPMNDGVDEGALPGDSPDNNEGTRDFPLDEPLRIDKIHKNYEDDEDDKAHEAETQMDDDDNDIYQAETQTLPFMSIRLPVKSYYPKEAEGTREISTKVGNDETEMYIDDDEDDIYQAETQALPFMSIQLPEKSSHLKEAGDSRETSKEVGNDDPPFTHADTKDDEREIFEQAETSIYGPTVLPSNVPMGFRFEPPPFYSNGFLENDNDGQAEEELQGMSNLPAKEFPEQAPVQLRVASPGATVCQTDYNKPVVDQVIGLDNEARDQIVAYSAALRHKPICDRDADENDKVGDSNLDNLTPLEGTHFKNEHDIAPTNDRLTRRRGVSSSSRRESSNDIVKIMFTGLVPTRQHKQLINGIGAQLVESIEEASSATRK
jgi:hypothetical protein